MCTDRAGLLATVANAGSLLLFATTASLRTRANHLITSLTVSDLGMAATQVPLLVVNSFSGRWVAPPWMCQVSDGSSGRPFRAVW